MTKHESLTRGVLSMFALALWCVAAQAQPAAAPESWSSIQAAARKEGRVVFYAQLQTPALDRIKAGFEKANPGILLEYSRIFGPALVTKVDAERKGGVDGADVISTADTTWFEDRAKEGSLKRPAGPAAKGWPAEYMLSGVTPLTAIEVLVMVYNTNQVKTPVTGLRDLVRPEFGGGKIVATSALASPQGLWWYNWVEKSQGSEFLRQFGAQRPKIIASAAGTTQAVAAGEVAISPWSLRTIAQPLIDQGAPMKIVVPQPTMGVPTGTPALGWSKRPNAALVLLDYLMSPAGAAVIAARGEMSSPLASGPETVSVKNMVIYNPKDLSAEYQAAFGKKWSELFQSGTR